MNTGLVLDEPGNSIAQQMRDGIHAASLSRAP
jgi:hypothetical protein